MESGHTTSSGSSPRGEDIASRDVVDKLGVEVGALVHGLGDVRENELGFGALGDPLATLEQQVS